jgi:hypothetical protein
MTPAVVAGVFFCIEKTNEGECCPFLGYEEGLC